MKTAIVSASLLLSFLAFSTGGAQEPDEDPQGEHCVSLNRIDRMEVIDEQNVLFHMKGGEIYVNNLPHRCNSLDRRDTLMYRTSMSRLCSLDIITVLEPIGFGFSPGISCGLGKFYRVTEEQAEELKQAAERQRD
jgi:hypothetical protein